MRRRRDQARPETAAAKPGTLDPKGLARMQRSAGNAAVRLMVQRSVAAAQPGRKPAPLPLARGRRGAQESAEATQGSLDRSKHWAAPPELPHNGLQRSPRRRASLPDRMLVGMRRSRRDPPRRHGARRGAGLGAGALCSMGRMLGMGEDAIGGWVVRSAA